MAENKQKEADISAEAQTAENAGAQQEQAEKKKSENKKSKNETVRLTAELDKIKAELDRAKDSLLRTAAEFDNYKRRTEKEKADIAAFVKAEVVKQLLPVADNIERAGASDPDSADYVKGLEMIIKQLTSSLERIGLKPIDALGSQFDPNYHEAVMHVEDDSAAENTVVQVLQTGYMLGDTVVRHAMV